MGVRMFASFLAALVVAGCSSAADDASWLKRHSGGAVFYDDFTTKADGEIMPGDVSDSGQVYTPRRGGEDGNPQTPPLIIGGALTHARTNLNRSQSFYLSPGDLGGKAWRIGCRFLIPSGNAPIESLVLIMSLEDWALRASNGDARSAAAVHAVLTDTFMNFDTYDGHQLETRLGRYTYEPLERNVVHEVEIEVADGRAVITLPSGQIVTTPENERLNSWRGAFIALQLYGPKGITEPTPIKVLQWWGDTSP